MGRSPCCDESGVKKGPWTQEEDERLVEYIKRNGHGSWRALPKQAGLNRCGKSCRLRWTNYLRPDIKRGNFTPHEEQHIINLHALLGNKWSAIASHLPGRTDNEIKNFWNTHLRKKLLQMGIDPATHRPRTDHLNSLALLPQLLAAAMQPDAAAFLTKIQLLHNMVQAQEYQTLLGNSTDNSLGLFSSPPTQQINPSHHQILPLHNNNNPNCVLDFPNQSQLLGSCFPDPVSVNQNQNTLPPLVSDSDDCLKTSQNMERSFKVHDASNHPSSSSVSTQEANWRDIFDAETSEPYWKDIIEEASSSHWPF